MRVEAAVFDTGVGTHGPHQLPVWVAPHFPPPLHCSTFTLRWLIIGVSIYCVTGIIGERLIGMGRRSSGSDCQTCSAESKWTRMERALTKAATLPIKRPPSPRPTRHHHGLPPPPHPQVLQDPQVAGVRHRLGRRAGRAGGPDRVGVHAQVRGGPPAGQRHAVAGGRPGCPWVCCCF
jgi:hypothetical protein